MSRVLFLATAAMLSSTPAHATDLVDAWRAAALHDPDHQSAEAERDAGQEAAVQARALKRPSVQVQAGYQYNMTETNAQLPEDLTPVFTGQRSSGRASVAVQAVQPIYDAAKGAQSTQLREKAAIADVQFEGEQQALILRVADAYFSVLSGEDKLTSYTRQVEAAEQQRKGAQARFDAGRARITDVREAEAQRDAAEAQRIGAEAELAYARAAFSELTGLGAEGSNVPPPTSSRRCRPVRCRTSRNAPRPARPPSGPPSTARARRGGNRPLRPVGPAGDRGCRRLPGTIPDGRRRRQRHRARPHPDRFAGVRLTVPLYAGGGIQSKEREAQANATKALRDLDAARRDARLQAQQAWQAASTGARRVAALNTALRSADLQQSAAATGRDVGIRTQNDVLNAQSQSFATDRDRAQAVYDYILARLKLAASTGDLGFEELDEADRLMTSIRPETRP
jgi:outer membrane protein